MNQAGAFFKTKDGQNIYYEVYGEGTPIVLIPGFLCTTRFFSRNIPDLCRDHQIIVLDCRGFGFSSKSGENMTIHRMAEDVRELMDFLQLQDAFLIGWSMGGNVAMAYYQLFGPHRLQGIGTLDSTLFPYGCGEHNAHNLRNYNLERFCDQMKQAYADYKGYCQTFARSLFKHPVSEEDEAWIVHEAMKCPVNCAFALYENFVHLDFEQVLPQISIPMLIAAANSPRTPKGLEMARHYKSLVPGTCFYHEFADAGHILFYESAEEFNQIIREFTNKGGSK